MATETKINDIASQLSTASRLVVSTDFFWVYTASGLQVKISAEFVKAYLVNGIKPSINANGNWEIDGKDLGVAAKGKTPQFRGGTMGIEVSYDDGKTWTQAVAYTDMNPDLTALVEAYNKVIQGEAGRVNAETARVKAEKARVAAENKRETDFSASKKACDDAAAESKKQTEACKTATDNANTQETVRQKAETTRNLNETTRQKQETVRQEAETTRNNNEAARKTAETKRQQDTSAAITNSQTQTAITKELNEHPVKMGDNGNWWQWNIKTHAYEDTGIVARGGAIYPTFKHVGNKLYIVDYGSNVSERVVKKGNKLVFRI